MIEPLLYNNIWFAIGSWTILYSSYQFWMFRIAGSAERVDDKSRAAQFYRRFASRIRDTTSRQKAVNEVIGRWWFFLCLIAALWITAMIANIPQLFSAVFGIATLPYIVGHLNHIELALGYRIHNAEYYQHVEREVSEQELNQASAIACIRYSTLFVFVFVLTGSWYFLGGALPCLLNATKLWKPVPKTP